MKNKRYVITIVILIAITIIIIINNYNNCYISKNYSFEGDSIDNYKEDIEKYTKKGKYIENVGIIDSKEKASEVAEKIFEELLYDWNASDVKDMKPYVGVYDEKNETWIIQGSIKISVNSNVGVMGSIPVILIKKTGEILAYMFK